MAKKYVDSKRLEITCGEAPFLTSRYDTTTGEVLVVNQRIGIIDRKLRVICENTDNEADWFKWAKRAKIAQLYFSVRTGKEYMCQIVHDKRFTSSLQRRSFTSSIDTSCPSSFCKEVTPLSMNPQGLI